MTKMLKTATVMLGLALGLTLAGDSAVAQFAGTWLDIGDYHATYSEGGQRAEGASGIARGGEFPAWMRNSHHVRGRALWIGVRNWTDESGTNHDHYVSRIGPRNKGILYTNPIQNKLIARYEDTEVTVDGALSFDNVAIVEEVDAGIPADRMVENIHNMNVGVTITRRAYAYANEHFDNFNVIASEVCNTGNTDGDAEIELDGQTLEDLYYFRIHRYKGTLDQGTRRSGGNAQVWGKYNMVDQVGDGHQEYPVDFTAVYTWYGYNPDETRFTNLGTSRWLDAGNQIAPGDSVGRLSGATMIGLVTLHADSGPNDPTYVRCSEDPVNCQPHTIGHMDQDEALTTDNPSNREFYELGILSRENPDIFPGGHSRMTPSWAYRVEPEGLFWEPTANASQGKQGGWASFDAFGPYDLAFGECINIAQAEGTSGLSWDAGLKIGRAFKRSGGDETALFAYDANGDGVINETPHNLGEPSINWRMNINTGTELQTKNQWVMSVRDSTLKWMQRTVDLWAASGGMTSYAIPEPPRAPAKFDVAGRPDKIDLSWTPNAGGPPIDSWEIYRTTRFEDNMLDPNGDEKMEFDENGDIIYGYELIATVPGGSTSYEDVTANRGSDYYYYLQAVGQPQPVDPTAFAGTPDGSPLRSSRYLTQTYLPVNLKRAPYGTTGTVSDARVVPNPVNLGADATVRFSKEDRVAFFNIPGNCTIKIYTELGELVHTIEHTDGSGDELWNLTTASRQLLVSGIYLAIIDDLDKGDSSMLKFTVIR